MAQKNGSLSDEQRAVCKVYFDYTKAIATRPSC